MLIGAMLASALLNNTPVVLMAIPIIVAIAKRAKLNPARHMMSLFYDHIAGMLAFIGSSTNLLVADAAARFTDHPLGFSGKRQLRSF